MKDSPCILRHGELILYDDIKAEVIVLYPEAIAAHSSTHAEFDNLVSDHACMLIRSETELGEFYWEFLLASCFLISKSHMGMLEQSHAFLGSLGPCLAITVCTQLERLFPDHFLDDPYDLDVIYDATRYVLAWQNAVLLVELLHQFLTDVSPLLTSCILTQLVLLPSSAFLPV